MADKLNGPGQEVRILVQVLKPKGYRKKGDQFIAGFDLNTLHPIDVPG